MSEQPHAPDLSGLRNPGVDYERSDAAIRPIIWFLVILAIAGVLIQLLLVGIYKHFAGPGVSLYERQTFGSVYSTPPVPPEPRLQPDPVAENDQMRESEEQRLHTYGWVDQQAGTAHIPIDRAMDLVAQRGIPARPPQPATQFREQLNLGAPAGTTAPAAKAEKK